MLVKLNLKIYTHVTDMVAGDVRENVPYRDPHKGGYMTKQAVTIEDIEIEIRKVMRSEEASFWLKDSLSTALKRDCVDAANDAEYLAVLLKLRCELLTPVI